MFIVNRYGPFECNEYMQQVRPQVQGIARRIPPKAVAEGGILILVMPWIMGLAICKTLLEICCL